MENSKQLRVAATTPKEKVLIACLALILTATVAALLGIRNHPHWRENAGSTATTVMKWRPDGGRHEHP